MSTQSRKPIDAEQLRIWRNYIETAEVLRGRLESRMQSDSALSSGDYHVLLALTESADRALRSSELADSIGWERSRLSHHLGRMEKRDLIRRERTEDDSRGSRIVLTEGGAAAFRRGSVPHLKAIQELFLEALSAPQLAHVEQMTESLREHLGLDRRD